MVYTCIYSQAVNFSSKDDIINSEEHDDCMFHNLQCHIGDEEFSKETRVGGSSCISVEGFEEENDMRRGEGTYQKL